MTVAALLPLAAALLAGDVPYADRVARLTPFFAPPPGGDLALDERELRDSGRGHKVRPGHLRGAIVVTPPRGSCLLIRRPDQDDERVCKQRSLVFAVDDLDKAGRLRWTVVTGDGDFGTELMWHSPYRVAIVTPFDKALEDPPQYRYLGACTASATATEGRRVRLQLLTGEIWTVRFPDQDKILPQPEAIPNLLLSMSGGKTSVKDAEKDKQAERAEKEATGAPAEGDPAPHAEAPPAPPVVPAEVDDRAIWAIPLRGAYVMSADAFIPYGGMPHGLKGLCRYNYKGPPDDPSTGRIECHDTDGFKAVYIPVICLGGLRQPPRPPSKRL